MKQRSFRIGPPRNEWSGNEPRGDCKECGGQCNGYECGIHKAGCSLGNLIPAKAYWIIAEGCPLYHGEELKIDECAPILIPGDQAEDKDKLLADIYKRLLLDKNILEDQEENKSYSWPPNDLQEIHQHGIIVGKQIQTTEILKIFKEHNYERELDNG